MPEWRSNNIANGNKKKKIARTWVESAKKQKKCQNNNNVRYHQFFERNEWWWTRNLHVLNFVLLFFLHTEKAHMKWNDNNKKNNTYKYSIIGFVTFCLQFHHVLDEDFGVATQQRFDAICWQKKNTKTYTNTHINSINNNIVAKWQLVTLNNGQ